MIEGLNNVLFSIEEYTTVLMLVGILFFWKFPKRKLYYVRLLFPVCYIIVFTEKLSFLMPWHDYQNFFRIPYLSFLDIRWSFLIAFLLFLAVIYFLHRVSLSKLLLYGCVTYVTQNLANCIFRCLRLMAFNDERTLLYHIISLFIIIGVVLAVYFILIRYLNRHIDIEIENYFLFVFAVVSIFLICVFSSWSGVKQITTISVFVYNGFADILLLFLLFFVFDRKRTISEKEVVEKAMSNMAWQQQYSKENIEMINRKCHDLKHQISLLKALEDSEERNEVINDLEKSIMIYDTNSNTGNKIIDALLTEKKLKCEANHIELSAIIDGNAVSFVKPLDLYTLLANGMDNAIEAEMKEHPEDRYITLHIYEKNGFAMITIDNYVSKNVAIEEGLPKTSKEDKENHGIGLKSIQYIAERYHGNIAVKCVAKAFTLTVLLNPAN